MTDDNRLSLEEQVLRALHELCAKPEKKRSSVRANSRAGTTLRVRLPRAFRGHRPGDEYCGVSKINNVLYTVWQYILRRSDRSFARVKRCRSDGSWFELKRNGATLGRCCASLCLAVVFPGGFSLRDARAYLALQRAPSTALTTAPT
jgi:hypothetical protein